MQSIESEHSSGRAPSLRALAAGLIAKRGEDLIA
jgi:hypothetical protein